MISFREISFWFIALIYSLYKYVIHLITGKCAILRIIQGKYTNLKKLILIEEYLHQSTIVSHLKLFDCESEIDLCKTLNDLIDFKMIQKEFKEECMHFLHSWARSYVQYHKMIREIEILRKECFKEEDKKHMECLLSIWKQLISSEPLNDIITSHWSEIGFQGKDPRTDLRGMGMLGLVQLEHLVSTSPVVSKTQVLYCLRPDKGYPFAISCINITAMIYNLLASDRLRLFFYSMHSNNITIEAFHQLFARVYVKFHDYYVSQDGDMMRYNAIKASFQSLFTEEINDHRLLATYLMDGDAEMNMAL